MMRVAGEDLVACFRELAPPHPPIKVQRWSVRRIGLTSGVALSGLVFRLTGCPSIGDAAPTCEGEGVATTFLMTQSVPAAKYVPCIEAMPAGWTIDTMDVKSSGSRFSFTLDRGGVGALLVTLKPRCDVSEERAFPPMSPEPVCGRSLTTSRRVTPPAVTTSSRADA